MIKRRLAFEQGVTPNEPLLDAQPALEVDLSAGFRQRLGVPIDQQLAIGSPVEIEFETRAPVVELRPAQRGQFEQRRGGGLGAPARAGAQKLHPPAGQGGIGTWHPADRAVGLEQPTGEFGHYRGFGERGDERP